MTSFHELPTPGFKSDFNSDVLYSQLRYQALLVQTAPIRTVHLLPDLMINSDEILSIEVHIYRIDNEERREMW